MACRLWALGKLSGILLSGLKSSNARISEILQLVTSTIIFLISLNTA